MTNNPVVSVLMTSYNREKYIGQAIESVLASDYRNLELIIVDDGSKDNTLAIAKSYAAKDSRVRVYVNEANLGDYPNRNKAASYAAGKYLKYVDSDDYIYPWGLSLLVQMMEDFPEAGWGLCSLRADIKRPFPFLLDGREAYRYHFLGPGLFDKAPLSSIIRREAFEAVKGFASIRMAGDFEMWLRLAKHYPVVLMPQGIIWYREHEEQEMSSFLRFARKYDELIFQYLKHPQCPLTAAEVSDFIKRRRRNQLKSMLKNLLSFRISAAIRNVKDWLFYMRK